MLNLIFANKIKERLLMKEKLNERLSRLKIDLKATELAIWIYELLESPTFKKSRELFLTESEDKKIQIGLYNNGLVTAKPFESYIMMKVADIFNKESNYTAEFKYSDFGYDYPFLKIAKKEAP